MVYSSAFEEFFRRFERVVDVDSFESLAELKYAVEHYAGYRWVGSYAQNRALEDCAGRRGFDVTLPAYVKKRDYVRYRGYRGGYERSYQPVTHQTWRFETVSVRGKAQQRYRDIKTGRFIKKP